jgi:carbonic anhydrase/acetyltransferase-like protein (isoleucine patch superfamily)
MLVDSSVVLKFGEHYPEVDRNAFVAPMTTLIGRVVIGGGASVWYGSVLRGDNDLIRVGERCNVQDGCILHADPGFPLILGREVSLGHGAVVHGSTVEDKVLIGMRATVLNGCRIGGYSLIAAGALVRENTVVPPRSLVAGVPGRIVREVTDDECSLIDYIAEHYVEKAAAHREALAHANPASRPPRP